MIDCEIKYLRHVYGDRAREKQFTYNDEASSWFVSIIELILYRAMCTATKLMNNDEASSWWIVNPIH